MKIWLALLTTLAVAFLVAGDAVGEPQITIPQPQFDFGYAPQGAIISHVFWLYSTGTDTLKIIQVSPG